MNDIASVMLETMGGDEENAYWCYKGFMDQIVSFFLSFFVHYYHFFTNIAIKLY